MLFCMYILFTIYICILLYIHLTVLYCILASFQKISVNVNVNAVRKDWSYRNNCGIRFHDSDLEHSPMKEK